jgi:hypothetical protein
MITELSCPAQTNTQATWALTLSGNTVSGTCVPGWAGSPTRTCQLDGTWSTVSNPCVQLVCGVAVAANANWPATLSGVVAIGNCTAGWGLPGGGFTTRQCLLSGEWDTTIDNQCTRTPARGQKALVSRRVRSLTHSP